MVTTRRDIQEQEPVVEEVQTYTEEEQLAPRELASPFGTNEFDKDYQEPNEFDFDYRGAIAEGYNLKEINQFLAADQGFDLESAYQEGYDDEEIIEHLSGGKIARSSAPMIRGFAEGAVEEGLGAYGLGKGFVSGLKTGVKIPGPPPVKLFGAAAGAVGGALTYAIAGQSLGELLTGLFTGGSDVVPSQRSTYEGGRTAGGTMASMMIAPYAIPKGRIADLGTRAMREQSQRILTPSPSMMDKTADLLRKGERYVTRGAVSARRSPVRATGISGFTAATTGTAAGVSEEVFPENPYTRFASEVGSGFVPTAKLVDSLSNRAMVGLRNTLSGFSQQGRMSSAGRRLREVFEDLGAKYNYDYDNDDFKAELAAAIEIEGLAKEFGMDVPGLTVSMRMQGPARLFAEAIERGLRSSGRGSEFAQESKTAAENYNIFAEQLLGMLLQEGKNDPSALVAAAEVRKNAFDQLLAHRVALAINDARTAAEKVGQNIDVEQQSKLINETVLRSYREAREQEKIFYDQVEEQLGGEEISASETLAALLELDELETSLPVGMQQLLRELRPEASDAELSLTDQRRQLEKLRTDFEEALRARRSLDVKNPIAQEIISGRVTQPGIVQGTLTRDRARQLMRLVQTLEPNDVSGPLPRNRNISVAEEQEMLRDAILILSEIPNSRRTTGQRALFKRLQADAELVGMSVDLQNRTDGVETLAGNMPAPEADSMSVYRLLQFRQGIRAAQRKLRPDPNNADAVRQLGEIQDATLRDLEKFSGDFGSPNAVIGPDGQFTFLDDAMEDGLARATDDRLEVLRRANAFTRSLHDVFTRTFAGDVRKKDSRGAFKIDPELLHEALMRGSGNRVALRMQQLSDAVNWLYSPQMQQFNEGPEIQLDEIADLNSERLGTLLGAETDIIRFFAAQTVDPETGVINPARAKTFLKNYASTLGVMFPRVFNDLNDGNKAAAVIKQIEDENVADTRLFQQTALAEFLDFSDSPGAIVAGVIGDPQFRPTNAIRNFNNLVKELNDAPEEAKEGLKDIILEQAFVYAGGAQSEKDFRFRALRDYLFRPMGAGKESPSVASILRDNGFLSTEEFNRYRILLDQADRIGQVMNDAGPAFQGDLIDSGFLLQKLVISFIGSGVATSAMEGARKHIPFLFGSGGTGNIMIPAAGASAARELFESQPNALVRDLFIEAFKNPKLLLELLEAAPTPKARAEKMRMLPAFLADAGIRFVTPQEPLEGVGIAKEDSRLPGERRRERRASGEVVTDEVDGQPQPSPETMPPQATAPEPRTTVPEQDALWSRVLQQESGNRQVDDQGRIMTSKVGALGVAQVMPPTAAVPGYNAPNIFRVASSVGVPINAKDQKDLDRLLTLTVEEDSEGNKIPLASKDLQEAKRLLSIKEVNEAFGRKYFDAMYSYFGGDPVRTLIAYNAGPDYAKTYKGDPSTLPEETQNYLVKILGVAQAPAPKETPPVAQAAPMPAAPATPAPAPITPQSLQRTAQVLGPQDEIGMLASELMMRQGPA